MNHELNFLTDGDVSTLRDLIAWAKKNLVNVPYRNNPVPNTDQMPDVYIVKTPADDTIPALVVHPTGQDVAGSAFCKVYRELEGKLWELSQEVEVLNLSTTAVAANKLRPAVMDRFGRFILLDIDEPQFGLEFYEYSTDLFPFTGEIPANLFTTNGDMLTIEFAGVAGGSPTGTITLMVKLDGGSIFIGTFDMPDVYPSWQLKLHIMRGIYIGAYHCWGWLNVGQQGSVAAAPINIMTSTELYLDATLAHTISLEIDSDPGGISIESRSGKIMFIKAGTSGSSGGSGGGGGGGDGDFTIEELQDYLTILGGITGTF